MLCSCAHSSLAKFFDHPLRQSNPLVLIAIFLAFVLQVVGGLSRQMCNFTLQLLKSFTATAIGLHGPLSQEDKELLKDFPTDVRTVRRLFDLDPPITVYAACPTCSMTYAPTFDANSGDIPIYPRRCSHRTWPSSAPCNARLTKGGVREGKSVRFPI